MEGDRLVKKAKFEPIGDILSPETAFIQAANALDVAGAMAIQHNDVEGISNVAALYLELATRLMGGNGEEEEHDHEDEEEKPQFGFSANVVEPEEVESVEPVE